MSFDRNFYKASAECPKCGSGDHKPKYIPPDLWAYNFALNCWSMSLQAARYFEEPEPKPPNYEKLMTPDKVINLCICGYEWEEKS